MKNMKKLLALGLAMMLLLAGCSSAKQPPATKPTGQQSSTPTTPPSNTEPDEPAPSDQPDEPLGPTPLVAVGEFSDVPGGMMTLGDLKQIEVMRLEITDYTGFKYVYAWEYVFATGRFTTYLADELYDEQTIYTAKGEDVACYTTSYIDSTFYLDPYADLEGYYGDLEVFGDTVEIFVSYSVPEEGIRYKRLDDVVVSTGEAYAYEIYEDDQPIGNLLVDKATGLAVCLTTQTSTVDYLITKIDLENAGIPQYK